MNLIVKEPRKIMSRKIKLNKEKSSTTRKIIMGALIGGVIGSALSLLSNLGFPAITTSGMITLVILGALIGVVIEILFALSNRDGITKEMLNDESIQPLRKAFKNAKDSARLQLRKEQLEISKELVQTADVISHKEIITEEKTITVPVAREELVIERKDMKNSNSDEEYTEIMRIPLTEEQLDVSKHTVKLEDVSIYTNQYEETEHIEEALKKEIGNIETSGNIKVVNKASKKVHK
jgi:uncharacterized protein (TIGR02271 family)